MFTSFIWVLCSQVLLESYLCRFLSDLINCNVVMGASLLRLFDTLIASATEPGVKPVCGRMIHMNKQIVQCILYTVYAYIDLIYQHRRQKSHDFMDDT